MAVVDIVNAQDGHGGVANKCQENEFRKAREGTPCHGELYYCCPILATCSVGEGRCPGDA